MATLTFTTPCGHEATAKPCMSRSGPNAGKWTCRIRGPSVTTKSGVKTKYCNPTRDAARKAIAGCIGIKPLLVTEKGVTTAAAAVPVVKKEIPTVTPYPPTAATAVQGSVAAAPVGGYYPGVIPGGPHAYQQPNYYGYYPPHVQPNHPFPYGPGGTVPPFQYTGMPHAVAHPPHGTIPPSVMMSAAVPPPPVTSTITTMIPTAEQERIYQHAKAPLPVDKNYCVRITAGAGAGKTTTVLQLAAKAARLGHKHITYLTFSRAAAADGQQRIAQQMVGITNPPIIEARTLHSSAMKLLAEKRLEEFQEVDIEKRLLDDDSMQKYIKEVCQVEVERFLAVAHEEIMNRNKKDRIKAASMLENAHRQVLFFVYKTLRNFCISPLTVQEFKDTRNRRRNYYPVTKFHTNDGDKNGFPTVHYQNKIGKYADMACLVWDAATRDGKRSYDLEMKRAQLDSLVIPGSLLLVDESQDMDGCQVDWIAKQVESGTHVYLVGDAAQTIYSFRGAKSKYLMEVKDTVDCTLTKSFRFGKDIANVANIVLFAKEKSPQTNANYSPIWWPYRVEGGGGEGIVTADKILPKWKEMPITIIASTNATLLTVAVSLMGMTMPGDEEDEAIKEEASEVGIEEDKSQASSLPVEPDSQEAHIVTQSDTSVATGCSPGTPKALDSAEADPLTVCIPKIHINGKGENSGIKKWKSVFKQIGHVYELYKSGDEGAVLPREKFYEFRGEKLTWPSFCHQVQNRELDRYAPSIQVVSTFKDKTMEAVEMFEREVTDKNYKADEADVILTTCHAAKGMEWDNVQLCEDFLDLCNVSQDGPDTVKRNSNAKRRSWQFKMKNFGDDVNLLYVACTRAKKMLSIPQTIKSLLQECDMLHTMIRYRKLYKEQDGNKSSDITVFGGKEPLSVEDALHLYQDVVLPIRKQCNVKTHEHLLKVMVKSLDDNGGCDYDCDKPLAGDDELEKYFAMESNAAKAGNTVASLNGGPPAKKQKLSKLFYALEDSKKSVELAPKGTKRPYDKKEPAPTGRAKCRDCEQVIDQGTTRIGIHVYQPDKREWWARWFHQKCCPKDILPQLKFDPNPPKKSAKSKSWSGKKGGGYYKKKYYNNGYRRSRWF